ncbi:Type II secretion system protein I [Zhongshania aliphaticivorans]|uniref:Type II secretion system protein I n=1 Tax=Zhongshania aliphaticivorans TaxID=1470434 RepID=A0A5S9QAX6_9GAMM|nr:type II secretion system minor pseudopilin GspI [Zhongshania aliphaticivorans]CAA0087231.1 Type II secretion system protein I [Zhongshania aliphaticivorans]CAA0114351.1 Type II secretion system protein I [Zhongshania aliphaticivorans]
MLSTQSQHTQALRRRSKGFTLLEIMVALVIFATAAVALSKSLTESANSVGALEERQFADLVAHNVLIDILRDGYGNDNTGKVSMAGFEFRWQRSVEQTAHPDMRRVDVTIYLNTGSDVLASRSAYLGQ